MSKTVLFFIHGIGTQQAGWEDSAAAALSKARKSLLGNDEFDERYEVVGLGYQSYFDDYIAQYNSRAEALKAVPLGGSAPGIMRKVVEIAQSGVDPASPWITHLGDVALYLGTQIGDAVRARIWDDISKKLASFSSTPRYAVIAHSLGTRVAHDVLQRAYTDDTGNTIRLYGKPRLLAMVANVVRLSSFSERHLERSVVYPDPDMEDGACYRYANIWHPLDPIARIRQFRVSRYPLMTQSPGATSVQVRATDLSSDILSDPTMSMRSITTSRYRKWRLPSSTTSSGSTAAIRDRSTTQRLLLTGQRTSRARSRAGLRAKLLDAADQVEALDLNDLVSWENMLAILEGLQ